MSGEGSKSKSRHHKSHHSKSHHSKSHKCDHAKNEDRRATEDPHGDEPESSKRKKEKHHRRKRSISMALLWFSTSWTPYYVDRKKLEQKLGQEKEQRRKARQRRKSEHRHKSERPKEPSQAGSEPRVREWLERTGPGSPSSSRPPSPGLLPHDLSFTMPPSAMPPSIKPPSVKPPSVKPPSVKPPSVKPPSIKPPSPGLPLLGPPPLDSCDFGLLPLAPPDQVTPAPGFPPVSNPPGPPPQIGAAEFQQEAKAASAASSNGRSTVRGAPPSENTVTSRKSRPKDDPGAGALTSRSVSRSAMGDNSSQRRKTEDTKTRTQDHELTIETDRKIPGKENWGKDMNVALVMKENQRWSRRITEDIKECIPSDRRTTHRESEAERNCQGGTAYRQTTEGRVTNEHGHSGRGTQSVRQASRERRHDDERSRGRQAPHSVQHHSSTQRHGSAQPGSTRHNSARHDDTRRDDARHGSSRNGSTRNDDARHGSSRHGSTRHDSSRHASTRHSSSRYDSTRRSSARHRSVTPSPPESAEPPSDVD
ncbi:hypothetical protein ACHAP5_009347 [Fusarium lateritium]